MNLAELQRKLLAAAKGAPANDRVPYAFEKRVMARLKSAQPEDVLTWWGRALWRGAAPCLAAAVLSLAVSLWPQKEEASLSELYDSTLYSATEQLDSSW
jgi:hypothetical protein